MESQQVSFWEVQQFVESMVAQANSGSLPWAGTPAWSALANGDPRKLLSVAVSGVHHVLRVEVAQQARADASKSVAEAADWSVIGRRIQQSNEFRAAHPWSKRVSG